MKNSKDPVLTVVCAWYQRSEYIRYTLDSILNQTLSGIELVVVDDGSPDESVRDILSEYSKMENVTVISQQNQGFVAAIMNAIKVARGEYLAIQGAGDFSYPKRLEEQLKIMRSDSRIAVLGCGYETVVSVEGAETAIPTLPKKSSFGLKDILKGNTGFTHGSLMFRRSMFEEAGGYRGFFKYGQDRDLLIRIMEGGGVGKSVPNVLYRRHAFESDGVSGNKRKLLIQQALVSFALQCHRDRKRMGYDYIDSYGANAMLFRLRDKRFSSYVAKLGLISLLVNDEEAAKEFLNISIKEKITLWGGGLLVFYKCVWPVGFMRRFVHLVANKHPRYRSWISKR